MNKLYIVAGAAAFFAFHLILFGGAAAYVLHLVGIRRWFPRPPPRVHLAEGLTPLATILPRCSGASTLSSLLKYYRAPGSAS